MSPRKRITTALIGLILLVVVGWFVREFSSDSPAQSITTREVVVDLGD